MIKANMDIREAAARAGAHFWQIADKLSIFESILYRKMRHELNEEEKKKILDIIEELSKEVI